MLMGAFMFAHFTHHVSNSMLNPLLPAIRDGMTLDYLQAGFLVSAFSLSQGFSQAPIGMLSDRVGSRLVITWGLIATGACMVLIGLSGEYWQLALFLVLLGIIAGTYHAPAATLISKTLPTERLGTALGVHIVGGNLSFFATPLVAGGLVAMTQTWRTPYLAFAFVPIVAGIFLMGTIPNAERPAPSGKSQFAFLKDVGGVFRVVGPLLSVAILFQMVYAALVAFLSLYLVDVHRMPTEMAAIFFSIPFIGGLLASPAGGYLSDRVGRKPIILFSLVTLGPLLLLLTLVPAMFIIPVLLLMGFSASLRMPVMEGLMLDRAPEERRATTLGAYYFLGQELGGIAAPALGALAALVGIGQAFSSVALGAAVLSGVILAVHRKL
jgi:MFS family permease